MSEADKHQDTARKSQVSADNQQSFDFGIAYLLLLTKTVTYLYKTVAHRIAMSILVQ